MFCKNCGAQLPTGALFCHKCGKSINNDADAKPPGKPSKPEGFQSFLKRKEQDRAKGFKQKTTCKQVEVKINVGLVGLDKDGVSLKIIRGSSLPLAVKKTASDLAVKKEGKAKHLAHNQLLRRYKDEEWLLLYPDLEVVYYLPGTKVPFSVGGYQEAIGKPFSRVTLYICRKRDFEDSLENDSSGSKSDDNDKTWTSSDEISFKSPMKSEFKANKKLKVDLTLDDDHEPDQFPSLQEILHPKSPSVYKEQDDNLQLTNNLPSTSTGLSTSTLPSCVSIPHADEDKDTFLIREYAAILSNETYSSDEEVETLNTGQDHSNSNIGESEILLEDILLELSNQISTDLQKLSKFNICRSKLWEGVLRALKKKSFSPCNKISVKFMDGAGETEGAVDLGGPQREFFTLALQYIMDSPMFCTSNKPYEKFLNNHGPADQEDHYFYAGCIIAMSLVHGGPAPRFFSDELFEAVVKTPSKVKVCASKVPDKDIRRKLLELQNVKTKEEMYEKVEPLETLIELAGALRPMIKLGDQFPVLEQTVHWYVFGRTRSAFDRLCDGLATLGVLEAMKQHPEAFRAAFCGSKTQLLTAAKIMDLFKPKRSDRGSNSFLKESEVLTYWADYVEELEENQDGLKLGDVLFFATGSRDIPPIGFRRPTVLGFSNEEGGRRFPQSNTCACQLTLPTVHKSYDRFKVDMDFALSNAVGFGHP